MLNTHHQETTEKGHLVKTNVVNNQQYILLQYQTVLTLIKCNFSWFLSVFE